LNDLAIVNRRGLSMRGHSGLPGCISAWARKTSNNRTAVSEALQNKKPISKKMLRALGLRKALPSTNDSRLLKTGEVVRLLRTQVTLAGSQTPWARDTGIQRPEISKVLRAKDR
jgi:hypothetical protein